MTEVHHSWKAVAVAVVDHVGLRWDYNVLLAAIAVEHCVHQRRSGSDCVATNCRSLFVDSVVDLPLRRVERGPAVDHQPRAARPMEVEVAVADAERDEVQGPVERLRHGEPTELPLVQAAVNATPEHTPALPGIAVQVERELRTRHRCLGGQAVEQRGVSRHGEGGKGKADDALQRQPIKGLTRLLRDEPQGVTARRKGPQAHVVEADLAAEHAAAVARLERSPRHWRAVGPRRCVIIAVPAGEAAS
mmetsp:Transcript_30773/g.88884  ORF Transcript_30773/g.88884 Transcript_30773/m.88884 type:complete len:247 (+) Transcript_30773:269-1009(+)